MKKGYLIAGIAFLLASVLAGWACLRNFNLAAASRDWRKTTGKILRAELQNLSVGRKENYHALITYTYIVNENIYHGTRTRFADTTGTSAEQQQAVIDQYPVDSTVNVYYDAQNPSESVLEPGGGIRTYGLMLPPLILAGIGMVLLVAGRRKSLGRS